MTQMYHYVYKTTNIINKKYYIGAHSTNNLNDGYLGSGEILKQSIEKHGKENFTKEILSFFNTRQEAFDYEQILVTESLVDDDICYNMCVGGLGCAVKGDEFKQKVSNKLKGRVFSEEHRRKKSLAQTGPKNHRYGKPNPNNPKLFGPDNPRYGKKLSEEERKKISDSRKKVTVYLTDQLRKQYSLACKDKLWYNNGLVSKRFYENTQPMGFVKGRKIRKEMGL
jgi:hypothetical protein